MANTTSSTGHGQEFLGLPPLEYRECAVIGLGMVAGVAVIGFPARYILFLIIGVGEEHRKVAQRTTELVVHIFARLFFLVLAVMAFCDPKFFDEPFTGWDTYLNSVTAIFLGHLIGQLIVTSSQFPLCNRHCSGQPFHLFILIICYTIVLFTHKDAAIAVVGLIIYFPGIHGNIHSVLKCHGNKNGCRINLHARIVTMMIFSFIIPSLAFVVLNVFGQTAVVMGGLYFSIFCLAVAYYAVVNFLQVRLIVGAINQNATGDLGTLDTSMEDDRIDLRA